jgi:hypothetical protein
LGKVISTMQAMSGFTGVQHDMIDRTAEQLGRFGVAIRPASAELVGGAGPLHESPRRG